MTSINVLKLNYHSGILLCDEARFWNPEWMIFYTPDKIRSVLREDIRKEQDLLLFFGQTGTSSIGDEFFDRIEKEIGRVYGERKKETGGIPGSFMSVEDLAYLAFRVIMELKHTHVNDFLRGKYGFDTPEFVRGEYQKDDDLIKIKDENIIKSAFGYVTFENNPKDVAGIFGNSQILAGYDPDAGFKIFYMTERMPVCEEVDEIFLAQGSGRDTCDLYYGNFASTRPVRERRGNIDRTVGLVAMLRGLAYACKQAAGVGGYPKIIYVNALEKTYDKRVKIVFDRRSKLASEIVMAGEKEFLAQKNVHELVEDLIFHDRPFAEVNERMYKLCGDRKKLFEFFRGYYL